MSAEEAYRTEIRRLLQENNLSVNGKGQPLDLDKLRLFQLWVLLCDIHIFLDTQVEADKESQKSLD